MSRIPPQRTRQPGLSARPSYTPRRYPPSKDPGLSRPPPAARPKRDWTQIAAIAAIALAGLPGLAALIALYFGYQAVKATDAQLQITEQGQITDRYNAAITNLGSPSEDVRLGGIYALQRLMQDSPRDQPTIVAVLCAFVRDHSATGRASAAGKPTAIQAALTVVLTRNTAHDGGHTVVDLSNTDLSQATVLVGANLARANLTDVYLSGANLSGADLVGADLADANLSGANLTNANLTHANLKGTILTGAIGLPARRAA